jgi:hypothetical protein
MLTLSKRFVLVFLTALTLPIVAQAHDETAQST